MKETDKGKIEELRTSVVIRNGCLVMTFDGGDDYVFSRLPR